MRVCFISLFLLSLLLFGRLRNTTYYHFTKVTSVPASCPTKACPFGTASCCAAPTGQLLYASPELRLAKGLNNKTRLDQCKGRLITPVEQISEAYWDTKWGKAMRDELKNKRFKK